MSKAESAIHQMTYRMIVAAKGALEASAYADVVRAIIECERFLSTEEVAEEVDSRVRLYLERMRGLETCMAALMAESDEEVPG